MNFYKTYRTVQAQAGDVLISRSHVEGLVASLAEKLTAAQFNALIADRLVGINRLILSETEPVSPQENDIWIIKGG